MIVACTALGLACGEVDEKSRRGATDTLLVRGVSVVDPIAGLALPPQDILISDGMIIEVATAGLIRSKHVSAIHQAEGSYALAGLIDVHAHIGDGGLGDQSGEDREGALAQFVRYGVTTIFVPGGGGGNDDDLVGWKRRCGARELLCPGIYGSGALITAPGSHPIGTIWNLPNDVDPAIVYERGAVAVAEDEEVGPLVARKASMGADAIKIIIEDGIGPTYPMPRLSNAKIEQLVMAGHANRLRVFAHVSVASHIEDGLAAGVDGFMHSVDDPIAQSTLATMAERRTYFVATLALLDGLLDTALARFEPEAYAIAGSSARALASLKEFRAGAFSRDEARVVAAAVRDNLRRAAAAGVPLALGTDVNNPSVFPGYAAHEELELMVEAGLSPARALEAATTGSASFLGRGGALGRIAPGYEADILILSENPLEDIMNTRTLSAVIHDGLVLADVVSATRP